MKAAIEELHRRLMQLPPSSSVRRVQSFLASPRLKPASFNPVRNSVEELAGIWAIRRETSRSHGHPIPGVDTLLRNFKKMTADAEIEQYSFEDTTHMGSLYFDAVTGAFLGDTIIATSHQAALQPASRTKRPSLIRKSA